MPKIRFVEVWRGWEPGQEYDCEDWFAAERIADGTAVLLGEEKPNCSELPNSSQAATSIEEATPRPPRKRK